MAKTTLPFDELFKLFGKELPSRAEFFSQKEKHGLRYRDLQKAYKSNTIYSAWKKFVVAYNDYVAKNNTPTVDDEAAKKAEMARKIAEAKAKAAAKASENTDGQE